jgi:hypothetical protein
MALVSYLRRRAAKRQWQRIVNAYSWQEARLVSSGFPKKRDAEGVLELHKLAWRAVEDDVLRGRLPQDPSTRAFLRGVELGLLVELAQRHGVTSEELAGYNSAQEQQELDAWTDLLRDAMVRLETAATDDDRDAALDLCRDLIGRVRPGRHADWDALVSAFISRHGSSEQEIPEAVRDHRTAKAEMLGRHELSSALPYPSVVMRALTGTGDPEVADSLDFVLSRYPEELPFDGGAAKCRKLDSAFYDSYTSNARDRPRGLRVLEAAWVATDQALYYVAPHVGEYRRWTWREIEVHPLKRGNRFGRIRLDSRDGTFKIGLGASGMANLLAVYGWTSASAHR